MTLATRTEATRSWKRIDGVDLLRGLAILLVLMNHVNMRLLFAKVPYTQGLPRWLVSAMVWNGQRGVQMFFVVSGFLITSTSLARWGSLAQVGIRDFYRLRFARIAPLLLALLGILSVLHLAHVGPFVVSARTGGLGRALLAALTFHINVLEAARGYLPGSWDILWSLSVEETFYFVFPVVCWLFGRSTLLIALLMMFALLGPFGRTVWSQGNEVWREYSYLGGMDAIALGCLTAIFVSYRAMSPRTVRRLGWLGTAIVVLSLSVALPTYVPVWRGTGLDMTLLALGTCMVIVAATQTNWRGPRLLGPLLILGQRSYEVYLTHMFLVLALFEVFLAAGKPLPAVPVLFVTVIVLAGVLGDLVARFYSEPANQWLRSHWNEPSRSLVSSSSN